MSWDVAGYTNRYGEGTITYVDTDGNHQVIASVASAPIVVDGSVATYAPTGAPYAVEYRVEGDRVKRYIHLLAPLPAPDPAVFPNMLNVYLAVHAPLVPDSRLTIQAEGQEFAGDLWTAATINLLDGDGNLVQHLDRIWARSATGHVCAGMYRLVQDPLSTDLLIYELIPYWWLRTLDAEKDYPVVVDPTVVASTSTSTATAYSNQRKSVRCNTAGAGGKYHLVDFWRDGSAIKYAVSQDDGASWSAAVTLISSTPANSFTVDLGSGDWIYLVYCNSDGGWRVAALEPNAGRTSWSISSELSYLSDSINTVYDYPSLIVHADGTGWKGQLAFSRQPQANDAYAYYFRFGVTSGHVLSKEVTAHQMAYYNGGASAHTYPVMCQFSATAFAMVWSSSLIGAGYGVRACVGAWSSGTMTWGANEAVDESYWALSGTLTATADSVGRVVVAYRRYNGSGDNYVAIKRRGGGGGWGDLAANSLPAIHQPTGLSLTTDTSDNVYLAYDKTAFDQTGYVRYTASSDSWGSLVQIEALHGTYPTVRRSPAGSALDVLYTSGSSVKHHRVSLNVAPLEPTITLDASAFDAADGTSITVKHNDTSGDNMSACAVKIVDGATTYWWRANDKTLQTSEVYNAASGTEFVILAADIAGKLMNGKTYQIYASTRDTGGLTGPYNSTGTALVTSQKPTVTITSGTSVNSSSYVVTWSVSDPEGKGQSRYRVKLYNADRSQTITDYGDHASATTFAYTVSDLSNATSYQVGVRAADGDGVWSPEVYITISVSYTPPLAPLDVTAAGDAAIAAVKLSWLRGMYQVGTFSRSSTAYNPETGASVASGTPRYVTGKFGQAIMVEEGNNNILTPNQSSVETDTTGFSALSGATLSRTTSRAWNGTASLQVVTDGSQSAQGAAASVTTSTNGTFTGSAYLQGSGTVFVRIRITYTDSSFVEVNSANITLTDTIWQRGTATATADPGKTVNGVHIHVRTSSAQAVTFYVDGLQIEQKAYATSWQIGGTARVAETPTHPLTGISSAITVEGWFKLDNDANTYAPIWSSWLSTGAPGPRLLIMRNNVDRKLRVWDGDGSTEENTLVSTGALNAGVLYHFAFTADDSGRKLFLNGVLQAQNARTAPLGIGSTAYVGHWTTGYLNGILDSIRISNIARSDAEIAAAYNANAPFTWDENTVGLYHWDGTLEGGNQNSTWGGSWRLERRLPGGSYTSLGTVSNPASGHPEYSDYTAASGQSYEYRVSAVGNNGTETAAAAVAGSIDITNGLWLHDPLDAANTIHHFQYREVELQETVRTTSGAFKLAGRSRPVVQFDSRSQEHSIRLRVALPKDRDDEVALRAFLASHRTLCLRDFRGRLLYGVLRELPTTDQRWGAWADVEFTVVDYTAGGD